MSSTRSSQKKDKNRSHRRAGTDRNERSDKSTPRSSVSQLEDRAFREHHTEEDNEEERSYIGSQPVHFTTISGSTASAAIYPYQGQPTTEQRHSPAVALPVDFASLSISKTGHTSTPTGGYSSQSTYGQQSSDSTVQAVNYTTPSYEAESHGALSYSTGRTADYAPAQDPMALTPSSDQPFYVTPGGPVPSYTTSQSTWSPNPNLTLAAQQPAAPNNYPNYASRDYVPGNTPYNAALSTTQDQITSSYQPTYPVSQGAATITGIYSTEDPAYGTTGNAPIDVLCQCEISLEGPKKCKPPVYQVAKTESRLSKTPGSKSSRLHGSSSSRTSGSSHSKASHKTNYVKPEPVPDSDSGGGTGCFVIDLPVDITPKPPPNPPGPNASRDIRKRFERESKDWEEEHEKWQHATCSCRNGYFNDNGDWISGADVRNQRELPNPKWPDGKRPW